MTEEKQYIVNIRPIDPHERGSHRLRVRFAQLVGRANEGDYQAVAELFTAIEARCYVPDDADYSLDDALDNMSSDEFDSLMSAIQGETVGEASDAS